MPDDTTRDDDLGDLPLADDADDLASLNDIDVIEEPDVDDFADEDIIETDPGEVYFDDISDDSVRLYLSHVENWSMLSDLAIAAKTVRLSLTLTFSMARSWHSIASMASFRVSVSFSGLVRVTSRISTPAAFSISTIG